MKENIFCVFLKKTQITHFKNTFLVEKKNKKAKQIFNNKFLRSKNKNNQNNLNQNNIKCQKRTKENHIYIHLNH